MTVTDRQAEGYEPCWDIDAKFGRQGQLLVVSTIEAFINDQVEVKTDAKCAHTGNLYVEYECWRSGTWKKSGIATTTANTWAFVIGPAVLVLPTTFLRDVALREWHKGRKGEEKNGSHPTKGALPRVSELVRACQPAGSA